MATTRDIIRQAQQNGILQYGASQYVAVEHAIILQDNQIAYKTTDNAPITSGVATKIASEQVNDWFVDTYENLEILENNFFNSKDNLIIIALPTNTQQVGVSAFAGCHNLENVYITEKTTRFKSSVFNQCSKLQYCQLPSTTEEVSNTLFSSCINLKQFYLPKNIKIIPQAYYANTAIENLILHDDVVQINTVAFTRCTNLKHVILNNGLLKIMDRAFQTNQKNPYKYNLEIHIPNSVIEIGANAFENVPHIYYNGTATGAPWGALAMN